MCNDGQMTAVNASTTINTTDTKCTTVHVLYLNTSEAETRVFIPSMSVNSHQYVIMHCSSGSAKMLVASQS